MTFKELGSGVVSTGRLQEGKRGSFLLPRRPIQEDPVIRQGLFPT